jgi:hypothetical protein
VITARVIGARRLPTRGRLRVGRDAPVRAAGRRTAPPRRSGSTAESAEQVRSRNRARTSYSPKAGTSSVGDETHAIDETEHPRAWPRRPPHAPRKQSSLAARDRRAWKSSVRWGRFVARGRPLRRASEPSCSTRSGLHLLD